MSRDGDVPDNGQHGFSLVCPFLTDDPVYAHGVEFGMLYERMKKEMRVKDYFTLENQEQILMLVNRLKWKILKMEQYDGQWFYLHARKL